MKACVCVCASQSMSQSSSHLARWITSVCVTWAECGWKNVKGCEPHSCAFPRSGVRPERRFFYNHFVRRFVKDIARFPQHSVSLACRLPDLTSRTPKNTLDNNSINTPRGARSRSVRLCRFGRLNGCREIQSNMNGGVQRSMRWICATPELPDKGVCVCVCVCETLRRMKYGNHCVARFADGYGRTCELRLPIWVCWELRNEGAVPCGYLWVGGWVLCCIGGLFLGGCDLTGSISQSNVVKLAHISIVLRRFDWFATEVSAQLGWDTFQHHFVDSNSWAVQIELNSALLWNFSIYGFNMKFDGLNFKLDVINYKLNFITSNFMFITSNLEFLTLKTSNSKMITSHLKFKSYIRNNMLEYVLRAI